jgi:hypothetical protein
MLAWIEQFRNASTQTKWFVFNCFIYGLVIAASLIYCYARLDFVRSGTQTPPSTKTP